MAGVDVERVSDWLVGNVDGVRGPFTFELIAGGRSNLTYRVHDAGSHRDLVLRRPPLGQVLATAHDMGREHRLIAAMGPTAVPVPDALGYCDDPAVTGAPFYVMSHVEGVIARDVTVAEPLLDEPARRAAGESLVDVLATLHALDPDEIGLGDLSRKDGYIERQLKRWYRQYEASRSRDIPDIEAVHARLATAVPEQGPASVVHGDYRIDNCVCSPEGPLVAVLDWELCTLGDPLADVGMLLICWTEAGNDETARPDAPTQLPGFPTRAEVVARYTERSGRDLTHLDFYRAFQYWRLACISEGVYARYAGGAMGDQAGVDLELISQGPPRLAAAATAALDGA